MTYTLRVALVAAAVAAVGLAGCGGGGTSNAPDAVRTTDAAVPPTERPSRTQATPAVQAPAAPAVQIPADARYTILCAEYSGSGSVQEAMLAKNNLIAATGRPEFHAVHTAQGSSQLYFGYYSAREPQVDPVEAKRVAADLAWLKSLSTPAGQRLFRTTAVVPLAVEDPEAPPEFDLTRIDADKAADDPTRAYWTIAIAAYTADARGQGEDAGKSRKQLAVDAVMLARSKYNIPAYFHHGENVSTICIGAWPRAAVREQEAGEAKSRGDVGEALVVSAAPLPQRLTEQLESSGRDIKVFQPKIEIVDPSLLETWKQFPTYDVNGETQVNIITDPNTQKRIPRPQQSFLVEIPRTQPTLLRGNSGGPTEDAPPPSLLAPTLPGPMDGTGGRLRSVPR